MAGINYVIAGRRAQTFTAEFSDSCGDKKETGF
jgi:hypothetical protein